MRTDFYQALDSTNEDIHMEAYFNHKIVNKGIKECIHPRAPIVALRFSGGNEVQIIAVGCGMMMMKMPPNDSVAVPRYTRCRCHVQHSIPILCKEELHPIHLHLHPG
jgi:hypothetical protein